MPNKTCVVISRLGLRLISGLPELVHTGKPHLAHMCGPALANRIWISKACFIVYALLTARDVKITYFRLTRAMKRQRVVVHQSKFVTWLMENVEPDGPIRKQAQRGSASVQAPVRHCTETA